MGEKEGNTAQPQRMKFYDAQTGELLGRTAGSWGEYFQRSFFRNLYFKNKFELLRRIIYDLYYMN